MTNNDNGQVVTLTKKARRKIRWGLTAIIVCSVLIGLTAGVFVTYKIVSKPAKRPQKFSVTSFALCVYFLEMNFFDIIYKISDASFKFHTIPRCFFAGKCPQIR